MILKNAQEEVLAASKKVRLWLLGRDNPRLGSVKGRFLYPEDMYIFNGKNWIVQRRPK